MSVFWEFSWYLRIDLDPLGELLGNLKERNRLEYLKRFPLRYLVPFDLVISWNSMESFRRKIFYYLRFL